MPTSHSPIAPAVRRRVWRATCAALLLFAHQAGASICGDANDDGNITATDALFALRTAVGTAQCAPELCDFNGDDKITATDALAILRRAVGSDLPGNCPVEMTGEVDCQELTPPPAGTCTVEPGDGPGLLLLGDVLTPGTIYRGGQVLVDAAGIIVHAGCADACSSNVDCAAAAADATVITCAEAAISPGLINPHEHMTFAQADPAVDTGERYEHRHEWRTGQNQHTPIPASSASNADSTAWTELRHLLAGATSMLGSGSRSGLLRNLDRDVHQEGLGQDPVRLDTFPLRDADGVSATSPSCNYDDSMITPSAIQSDDAYVPHVAEGINARARNEAVCLGPFNAPNDVTLDKTSFIHGIGVTMAEYETMAERGTGLVWSPRSEISLYGNTAVVTAAHRMGIDIALGTDWMITGSFNLLRELRCADTFNQTYLDGYFSDQDLWQMVTSKAAVVSATDDAIGILAAGSTADIAIFRSGDSDGYGAVVDADLGDVALVLRGGVPLYGDADVMAGLPGTETCDAVEVCSTAKTVCLLSETGKTLAQLEAAVGSLYSPFQCGMPDNERTCTPKRGAVVMGSTSYTGEPTAEDPDGDGIATASDNCPTVFNPVRPMDAGPQADHDADGEGDACDPCPVDASTTDCPTD